MKIKIFGRGNNFIDPKINKNTEGKSKMNILL